MTQLITTLVGAAVAGGIGLVAGPIGGVVGVVVGAVGGWFGGGAIASASVGSTANRAIDPFAVTEPWRHMVQRAVSAQRRLRSAVGNAPSGPLTDRLADLSHDLDRGVGDAWAVAQTGHALSQGRSRLDIGSLERRRGAAEAEANTQLAESLSAQIASARRFEDGIDSTAAELEVVTTRLEEAAVRAEELATRGATIDALDPLATELVGAVDALEALRQAVDELDGSPTDTTGGPAADTA